MRTSVRLPRDRRGQVGLTENEHEVTALTDPEVLRRLAKLEDRVRQLEKVNRQLLDLLAFTGGVLGERAARALEDSCTARS